MVNLVYNETRKLLAKKKTLVIFIAFLFLIGFMMFAYYKEDQNRERYSSPEFRIENLEQSLENLKHMKGDPKIPEEDKKYLTEQIDRNEEELKALKESPNQKEVDWKLDLNQRIEDMEITLKEPYMSSSQKEEYKLKINQYKYLLNNNIKYDENTANTFNFLEMLFEILGAIFLAVLSVKK